MASTETEGFKLTETWKLALSKVTSTIVILSYTRYNGFRSEGKCSIIVSGDRRDLLSLKRYRHVEIVTARQFLDRIHSNK